MTKGWVKRETLRHFLFAVGMVFITALAFTDPATSGPDLNTEFISCQL